MKTYLCKPEKQDKATKFLVFALMGIAFFLFFLSVRFTEIKALLQLFTAALLLLVIQITNRFLLTQYRYGFEDGYLLLSSRQGRKEKSLGGIPITAETKLLDRKTWEREQKSIPVSSRFSYCQNLSPKDPYYLLSPEEKGYVLLIFEPDETLLSLLNQQIQTLKGAQYE